jgi:hypothetical protein
VAALAPVAARGSDAFQSPAAGESLAPDAIVEIRWASLCDDPRLRALDEAEIVLSLDGGETFPVRVSTELKPCSARYLWKVPALPTAHARIALRAGEDERDTSEVITVISAEFRILPDPDGRVQELRRRAAEWWVPCAPAQLSAEDLLEHNLSPAREAIELPVLRFEIAAPSTGASAVRPEPAAFAAAVSRLDGERPIRLAPERRSGASTPLRL